MDQRDRKEDMPNRQSGMEPAEGSRETVRNSGSDERMRGSTSDESGRSRRSTGEWYETVPGTDDSSQSGEDLGTSSDRAMFDERVTGAEREDLTGQGSGAHSGRDSSDTGISNRGLDRERESEERLPERGRSKSEF